MAIRIIDSSSDFNRPRATYRSGAANSSVNINSYDTGNFDVTGLLTRLNPERGSWSYGTGLIVDSNGTQIFNSLEDGGALSHLLMVNRGSTTVWYGLNNDDIAEASGGMTLESGESVILENTLINKIWVKTQAGTTSLQAQGLFKVNGNTI